MSWNKRLSLVLDVDQEDRLIGWTGFAEDQSGRRTLESMGVGDAFLALSEIASWLRHETRPETAQVDGPTDG